MVIFGSPKTAGHSAKARVVATTTEVCPWSRLIRWKSRWPPACAKGRWPVEHDEVHAVEMVGETALAFGAGLGFELVDEIDHVEEAAAGAAADAGAGDADGEVRLAGACAADRRQVALLGEEPAAGEVAHERLVDRRGVEGELVDFPGGGGLAMAIWCLIERVCFSESSAVRGGSRPAAARVAASRLWRRSRHRRPACRRA